MFLKYKQKKAVGSLLTATTGTSSSFWINKQNFLLYFQNTTSIVLKILHLINTLLLCSTETFYITIKGGGSLTQLANLYYLLVFYLKISYTIQIQKLFPTWLQNDYRVVERKKAGCQKARKHKQYSKR